MSYTVSTGTLTLQGVLPYTAGALVYQINQGLTGSNSLISDPITSTNTVGGSWSGVSSVYAGSPISPNVNINGAITGVRFTGGQTATYSNGGVIPAVFQFFVNIDYDIAPLNSVSFVTSGGNYSIMVSNSTTWVQNPSGVVSAISWGGTAGYFQVIRTYNSLVFYGSPSSQNAANSSTPVIYSGITPFDQMSILFNEGGGNTPAYQYGYIQYYSVYTLAAGSYYTSLVANGPVILSNTLSNVGTATFGSNIFLTAPGSNAYAGTVLSYNTGTGAVKYSSLGAADSNTMNANWVTSGGGTITWNGSVVSGTNRIIAIPVNITLATDGYLNIGSDSGSWSITMGAWAGAYWVPNSIPSGYSYTNGSIQVVPFQYVGNNINSNWIFICATNGDNGSLKWGPGFINIPSGGVYNSATGATSWNVGPSGSTGPTGPIGGADTQILFNNAGTAGGSAALTFNNTTGITTMSAVVIAGAVTLCGLPFINDMTGFYNLVYNPTTGQLAYYAP
jgi:hypothetical protein